MGNLKFNPIRHAKCCNNQFVYFSSFVAVKNLLRDIVSQLLITSTSDLDFTYENHSENCDNMQVRNGTYYSTGIPTTVTNLAKDYAEKASSVNWTHFLDVLLGKLSLIVKAGCRQSFNDLCSFV